MSEFPTPEHIHQAHEFGKAITEKGLPIGQEKAARFGEFLLGFNPPQGLLDRLTSAAGFISEESFNPLMNTLTASILDTVKGRDYALVQYHMDRSGQWMYEQALRRGLPPAYRKFAEEDYEKTDYIPLDKLDTELPPHTPIILLDDWSITGMNIDDLLVRFPDDRPITAFLLATTRSAEIGSRKNNPFLSIVTARTEPIPELNSILKPEDIQFFQNILDQTISPEGRTHWGRTPVLFGSFHKTPDNLHDIFTGERLLNGKPLPPLIEPVIPIYENK